MKQIEILSEPMVSVSPEELTQHLKILRQTPHLCPFAPELLDLISQFSNQLLNDAEARQYPELQVLGFWLRKSSLENIKNEFAQKPETIAVPQGITFHMPPANVDTMFAYSLFISLLCGNANIIRLPSKRGPAMLLLLRLLNQLFQTAPAALQKQLFIIGYDHDAAITESISKIVDMRVLWGSDKTIETIRQLPLASYGRELIFPDRFSWSAINASAYHNLADDKRQLLAEQYFNDLFWFDQGGCASPRILLWQGNPAEEITHDFYQRLGRIAKTKNWQLDASASVARQTRNYEAMASLDITDKHDFGSALTIFSLQDLDNINLIRNNPCFGGTLFKVCINQLQNIIPAIERRDQTLTHFGFEKTELEHFVRTLNGKGLDRIVPIGEALSFDTVWDGYDLPENFTRRVTLKGGL